MGGKCSKKKMMRILSLLLAAIIFLDIQGMTVFAETISGNEGTEDREQDVSVTYDEAITNNGEEGRDLQIIAEDETSRESDGGEADAEQTECGDILETETVSSDSIRINRTGAGEGTPANPVHHCTKKNDGTDYTDFSYIYFGSYPQGEITDKNVMDVIDKAIEKDGIKGDIGTDVWVNGTKYRRISKNDTNDGGFHFNDMPANNGYRYFKWQRIKWRVLQNDGDTLHIVADKAIECKTYYEITGSETATDVTWEASSIRNWLNQSFYDTAFNDAEQAAIVNSNIANEDNSNYNTAGRNHIIDKIYLLSASEVTSAEYGFCSGDSVKSMSRMMEASAYANARGISSIQSGWTCAGNCTWWLRAIEPYSKAAAYVRDYGSMYQGGDSIYYNDFGVCPALHIKLSSGIWSMMDDEVNAGEGTPGNPVHHCRKLDVGIDYTDFSYIYFGSYPQSEVTDSAVIASIDKAIQKYGTKGNVGADVWVNGIKYRRISKDDTNDGGSQFKGMPASNGYRYFRWERIKWKVLQTDGRTLFAIADQAIDCEAYNKEGENVTWEKSTLRDWLNTSFYHTAFSSNEQSTIIEQTVVNGDNAGSGNNTRDKIYLLSIGEATNGLYGFCGRETDSSMSRSIKTSDYANARGTWKWESSSSDYGGSCRWWLRQDGNYILGVLEEGNIIWNIVPDISNIGICPALNINLSSNIWYMMDDGTSGEGKEEKAANPSASIPTGSSVAKNTKLTLSSSTAGADIYYTTDGTMPTMESAHYTDEIVIDRDMTVKAVAMCRGYRPSDVAEFTYKTQGSGSGEEEKKDDGNKNGGNETGNIKIQKLTIKAPSKKLAAGKKVKLTLNVAPKNATNKAVRWKTSNKKYATVNKNGKITLKKKGIGKKVTITATSTDGSGRKASIKIKIMRHAVKSIKLTVPGKTLKAGKTMTIKATVKTTGKNANKALKWKTSNKKYATVNKKGKVTAKKAGKGKTVTITATSTDGSNKKAKVKIKIK